MIITFTFVLSKVFSAVEEKSQVWQFYLSTETIVDQIVHHLKSGLEGLCM